MVAGPIDPVHFVIVVCGVVEQPGLGLFLTLEASGTTREREDRATRRKLAMNSCEISARSEGDQGGSAH